MIQSRKPQVERFNPKTDGNPFYWIHASVARQRAAEEAESSRLSELRYRTFIKALPMDEDKV